MLNQLIDWIESSDNIVFFGGAGVSTESGIPDFRSADGIFQRGANIPPEVILSHDFFYQNSKLFYDFYFAHLIYDAAQPNATHLLLARLEKMGKLKAVITQNIDGLHQRAGSDRVLELHGSTASYSCTACNAQFDLATVRQRAAKMAGVPKCQCGAKIKPNVVLYGESLDGATLSAAIDYIAGADMLIVAGTSLVVYPAAGLINHYRGDKLVLINAAKTSYDRRADLLFNSRLKQVVEPLLEHFAKR